MHMYIYILYNIYIYIYEWLYVPRRLARHQRFAESFPATQIMASPSVETLVPASDHGSILTKGVEKGPRKGTDKGKGKGTDKGKGNGTVKGNDKGIQKRRPNQCNVKARTNRWEKRGRQGVQISLSLSIYIYIIYTYSLSLHIRNL